MEQKNLIDLEYITKTLYGDEAFIKEFCEAAILSFSEFKTNFNKYLKIRNETELRKAGHKIKPAAQMLSIDPILKEYEHSKILITSEANEMEIQKSVEKMTAICDKVLIELQETISKL